MHLNHHPLATATLPLIPTSTIGSSAPMGWLTTVVEAINAGQYGAQDIEESLTDAVDLAVLEQQRLGIDILVDGEMRRLDFNLGFYGRIAGLVPQPLPRRLGPAMHDQRGKWRVTEELALPDGLGVVDEVRYLLSIADRPVKATVPGPYTLAGRLDLTGSPYANRIEAAWALSPFVRQELLDLVALGVDLIYLDEPSIAVYPKDLPETIPMFNATVAGVDARIGTHLCFGNWRGRPVANRTYAPLVPAVLDLHVAELSLELANREMADVELLAELAAAGRHVAAGLVDVKNTWCEPAEVVADRIRQVLRHVAADHLSVTPDCGMSQTARWAARRKLTAMVEGAKIVRAELTGERD